MKSTWKIIIFSFQLLFLLYSNEGFCQYSETFSTANKGILQGPCGATSNTCAMHDFTGVNWFINGNLAGIDSGDFISSDGSDLSFEDVDEEVCWESPEIDISAVSGNFSISVDLTWVGFDSEDFINVDYKIDGGSWVQVPNVVGGGAGTIQYTSGGSDNTTVNQTGLSGTSTLSIRVCIDFNGFGTFENAHMDNVSVPEAGAVVLPVELISFKAENQGKGIVLKWITGSELNNEKFEVEYSTSGKEFKKIGEIAGKGTSVEVNHYSFKQERPSVGLNYYRLKQVDFDGHFDFSKVVSVLVESDKKVIGDFYPNPSKNGMINLEYSSNKNSDLHLSIYNTTGIVIFDQKYSITKGENNLNFDFSILEKGIYIVQLESFGTQEYRKLMIN